MGTTERTFTSKVIIRFCYVLCIGAQVALCVLAPLVPEHLLQVPTYTIHFGVLGSAILLFLQNIDGGKIDVKYGAVLGLLFACCASMIVAGRISYTNVIKIICFLEMLLAMHLAYSVGADLDIVWVIRFAAWVTALGFIIQYRANLETEYGVLFLGLNKNYSGAMLLLNAALCLVLSTTGGSLSKLISLIAFGCSSYLLFISRCRTGMAVLAVVFIAILFGRQLFCTRWFKHVTFAAPIIVMIILLAFPSLNEIEIFGGSGSLTSERENIYAEYFSEIGSWLLLGNIAEYQLANAHNGALALMASLGIVGYSIWYANQQILFETIRPDDSHYSTQTAAYVALVACMLIACTEAIVYIQGQQISIMLSLFVYMASYGSKHVTNSR